MSLPTPLPARRLCAPAPPPPVPHHSDQLHRSDEHRHAMGDTIRTLRREFEGVKQKLAEADPQLLPALAGLSLSSAGAAVRVQTRTQHTHIHPPAQALSYLSVCAGGRGACQPCLGTAMPRQCPSGGVRAGRALSLLLGECFLGRVWGTTAAAALILSRHSPWHATRRRGSGVQFRTCESPPPPPQPTCTRTHETKQHHASVWGGRGAHFTCCPSAVPSAAMARCLVLPTAPQWAVLLTPCSPHPPAPSCRRDTVSGLTCYSASTSGQGGGGLMTTQDWTSARHTRAGQGLHHLLLPR